MRWYIRFDCEIVKKARIEKLSVNLRIDIPVTIMELETCNNGDVLIY